MEQNSTLTEGISMDAVESIIVEQGYDVTQSDTGVLKIRDIESNIVVQAVLEENVLFLTVPCINVPRSAITPAIMTRMLDADNGISTSNFQLYTSKGEKVTVTLNNFCKLQQMGPDDQDDILSCVEFLLADVVAARGMLVELAE
ncbi:MAG: hypothetical protein K9M57_08435 [Phycisphaerae bacterium]|nr:hypothetical protein [Phycisphaerae bacterium]